MEPAADKWFASRADSLALGAYSPVDDVYLTQHVQQVEHGAKPGDVNV
jgi:hypothetical protein